jgi:hypothetical protein
MNVRTTQALIITSLVLIAIGLALLSIAVADGFVPSIPSS